MRQLAVVVTMLGLLAPAPGVADEVDDRESFHFEVVRTTDGPSSFRLILHMSPPVGGVDIEAFGGAVAFRTDEDGQVQAAIGLGGSPIGGSSEIGVFVNGTEVSTCTLAGVCDQQPTFGATKLVGLEDEGGPETLNRFYVIVDGRVRLNEVRFEAVGWTLAPTSLEFAYVDFREAQGIAAAVTPSDSADVFRAAELGGGELGSIAQAVPPCSSSITGGVGRGVGTMELTGGREDQSITCPILDGARLMVDHTPHPTRWLASGVVAGDASLQEGRLFVVDLPECQKLIPGVVGYAEVDC